MLISGFISVRKINQQKREERKSLVLKRLNNGEQLSLYGNIFSRDYILALKEKSGEITLKLEGNVSIRMKITRVDEKRCGLCLGAIDENRVSYKISCLKFGRTMTGSIQKINTEE